MSKSMYNHQKIEEKWQKFWDDQQLFQDSAKLDDFPGEKSVKTVLSHGDDHEKNAKVLTEAPNTDVNQGIKDSANKLYLLFAFAYPSGSGLHVGHVESKTALDILARYYRMNGKDVFFPVGWDAFGLPAENYSIKTGVPPAKTTKDAIHTFRRQVKRVGISYDWANEIATCHPGYYKWTQWLFLELYKKSLAYQAEGRVNWCPSCQTVLANEQVVNGVCERCGTQVEQRMMKQWFFKITDYKDELIDGLEEVDWPEPTKQQQVNWIGRKTGIEIHYPVVNQEGQEANLDENKGKETKKSEIVCFTTRPDTNFGATFVVLAPEHPFAQAVARENLEVKAYLEAANRKTDLERQQEGRKKSGAFTGFYALNQLTNKKMPIWVSDFVLGDFGTGAVVGVPAHDKRDFEFAQFVNQSKNSHQIEIIRVVVGADGDTSQIQDVSQVQEEAGTMVHSDFLNGMDIHQATQKVMDYLEEKGWGNRVTSYRLRDWLISRQRYWGAPIPIVYDPEGNAHPVKEEHLPWKLPEDVDFKPTGESPLKSSQEFIKRTEELYGKGWRPEFDTMDTFVCSSWYYLRYVDSRNEKAFADKKQLQHWLPVDFYMIGPEHIVLHLLYARFFTKFLRDQGYVNFNEPFLKMRHQGMILGPDGKKMSKSKGNVINPDEVIEKFGADTLRIYEMFMGPIEADKPWNENSVVGVHRFLRRLYELAQEALAMDEPSDGEENPGVTDPVLQTKLHQTIRKVSQDIPDLKFNTTIAALMEFVNVWEKSRQISREDLLAVIRLVAPLAPFLAEELWHLTHLTREKQEGVHQGVEESG